MEQTSQDLAFWTNKLSSVQTGRAIALDRVPKTVERPLALAGFALRSDLAFHRRQRFWPQIDRCQVLLLPASTKVTARAYQQGQRKAVVLHGGLLRELWRALWMIVAQSEPLQEKFGWEDLANNQIEQTQQSGAPMFLDQSKGRLSRQSYLQELFGRAVEFILFHEIAHHGRGHLDRLFGSAGLQMIDEAMNMASRSKDVSDLSRLMEFDADWMASEMCLNATAHIRQDDGQSAGFEDRDHMTSELALHVLAQSTLFMVLDKGRKAAPVTYDELHPPALHRAVRVTVGLGDTVQKATGMTRDQIGGFMNQAWADVVLQAERMGYPSGLWNGRVEEISRLDRLERVADRANAFTRELSLELHGDRGADR